MACQQSLNQPRPLLLKCWLGGSNSSEDGSINSHGFFIIVVGGKSKTFLLLATWRIPETKTEYNILSQSCSSLCQLMLWPVTVAHMNAL